MDGWTDGWADAQISPVFYRTSSPLGPLPKNINRRSKSDRDVPSAARIAWQEIIIPGHQMQMKCGDPLSFGPYGFHNGAD